MDFASIHALRSISRSICNIMYSSMKHLLSYLLLVATIPHVGAWSPPLLRRDGAMPQRRQFCAPPTPNVDQEKLFADICNTNRQNEFWNCNAQLFVPPFFPNMEKPMNLTILCVCGTGQHMPATRRIPIVRVRGLSITAVSWRRITMISYASMRNLVLPIATTTPCKLTPSASAITSCRMTFTFAPISFLRSTVHS